jgi:hypothetical protein
VTAFTETPKQIPEGVRFIDGDERAARSPNWHQPPMEGAAQDVFPIER